MNHYTRIELEEALRAIRSTICKCEKVQPKLLEGTSQHTLLKRRIKAFQIAADLIVEELSNLPADEPQPVDCMAEYKRLLQTTNLQKGYQEFVRSFRQLRTYLQKELPGFSFTGNVVENNMDYAYFQFTDDQLKSAGLKIVIAFVHADFELQIWLSGLNREIQTRHHLALKDKQTGENVIAITSGSAPQSYELTKTPAKTDYIIKAKLTDKWHEGDTDEAFEQVKDSIVTFAVQVSRLLCIAKRP